MKDYHECFDIKNQKRLDELYQYAKKNEKVKQAYLDITKRNQSISNKWNQYQTQLNQFSKAWEIISTVFVAIVYIIGGSFVLGTLATYIVIGFIDYLAFLYDTVCQLGVDCYNAFFSPFIGLTSVDILENISKYSSHVAYTCGFHVLGAAYILIVIFTVLYVSSFFTGKEKIALSKKMTLSEAYACLQVDENDRFEYIRYRFLKKLTRRNKPSFQRYYQAYLLIFENHQDVQGNFSELHFSQKIHLVFFTILNTLKNIFGSLTRPLLTSLLFIMMYCRTFTYTDVLSLKTILQVMPFGKMVIFFSEKSYQMLLHTPLSSWLLSFDDELSKVIAFCIGMTLIWFIVSVCRYKIVESRRQYQRRLHYEIKKNKGIYDSDYPYSSCALYTRQFVVLVLLIFALLGYWYFYRNQPPIQPRQQSYFIQENHII